MRDDARPPSSTPNEEDPAIIQGGADGREGGVDLGVSEVVRLPVLMPCHRPPRDGVEPSLMPASEFF